jgi:hypothetical protein
MAGVVPSVLAEVARTVRPAALDVAVGYLGLSLHSRSLVRDVCVHC